MRWVIRIVGGLLLLFLATSAVLFLWFSVWLDGYKRELPMGSTVAITARGPVEYASLGEGPAVLRLHGSPGGYDAGIYSALTLPEENAGYLVVAPSRPGYLRTPVASGRTPAGEADLYAALLDELKIDRVIVSAASGGAPAAVQFAIRYPKRTRALVLVVPLLQSKPGAINDTKPSAIAMTLEGFMFWFAGASPFAAEVAPRFLPGVDGADPVEMTQMGATARSFVAQDIRWPGRENDLNQYAKLGIETWPLEQIKAPVLILHGTADVNAPYAGSVKAAARMPNATLVSFPDGEHTIIVSEARPIRDRVKSFLAALPPE